MPRRQAGLTAQQREELGLAGKERVLAHAPLVGGGHVAATMRALYVLTPRGRLVHRPWLDVDHVAYDDASATLAVWWVGSRAATALELPAASFVPEVVHERVRSSVVASREVSADVGGRRATAWVALRRDCEGELTVQSVPARAADAEQPALRAAMAAAAVMLRQDAGLPAP